MAQTPQQEARAALTAMLEAHAHEAAALDAGAMRALVPILEQSRAELNRDLAAWLARGKGEDRYTVQAYRQSVLAIDAQLQVMQQHLAPALGGILVRHDAIARALANTHAAKEFLAFSTARTVELNPTVPLKIADVLANGRRAPMARYETSAARYAGQVATDIRRELAVGVVRGETNDQLVARLRALGGPRGSVAVRGVLGKPGAVVEVIPEGLFARYESWAERIVRTELAHAYTEQVQDIRNELVHDFPDMVRRWDATVDGRVCVRCGEMNGKDTDPKTDTFPGGVDVPLHPNCRCRAGLWRASWARFMDPNYVDPGGSAEAPVSPPAAPSRPQAAPAAAHRPRVPEAQGPAWSAPRPRVPEAQGPAWTAPAAPAESFASMPVNPHLDGKENLYDALDARHYPQNRLRDRAFNAAMDAEGSRLMAVVAKDDIDAFAAYCGSAYQRMNTALRLGLDAVLKKWGEAATFGASGRFGQPSVQALIERCTRAVRAWPKAPPDMVLFRGASFRNATELERLARATTITEKGFLSTSRNPMVAQSFGGNDDFSVVYRVRRHSGGAIVTSDVSARGEAEVLFEPGAQFRVVARQRVAANTLVLDLEQIP